MNYGELKAQFEGLLKRRDLTPTQSDTFLQQAVSRVQRVLRIPPMEKSVTVVYDGETFTDGELPVPSDYLRLIALTATTPEGHEGEIKQRDLQTVLEASKHLGLPSSFVRRGGRWKFGPMPPVGTVFRIDYYDEFGALEQSTDSNYLTVGANDLVIYGALSFAGDWFIDKRAPVWEGRFQSIVTEIQNQADQDALINSQVSAAYQFPSDD